MAEKEQIKMIEEVQLKYDAMLSIKAHVLGTAIGYATIGEEPTNELCLVTIVDEKLPENLLLSADLIPKELEGIRVDVQALGTIQAQI